VILTSDVVYGNTDNRDYKI